ncbi:Uncharacterised protein [Mycobacteroides abscessus subsp. abscessus]|nr:Uncharacterised protein [Mycobacteroides abscessus subsp. abscessus]
MASEADARLTLVSVTPPTPRSMTRNCTSSSIAIPSSASSRASTVPALSPLRIRFSWLVSFSAASRSSRLIRLRLRAANALRLRALRRSAICRAMRSSSTTSRLSPAPGTEVKPMTWTGRDGKASSTSSPCSSTMRRTRPYASPATIESPTRSVPRWMSTVATGPRPRSRCASMATPWASMSGLARRSRAASAVSNTASSNCSMLVPCLAEMSTNIVSPPKSSATKLYSVS